jgi:ELWxxDGT repeat protein
MKATAVRTRRTLRYNGALYFSAMSNDGAGVELYRFDGTTATRVTDLNESATPTRPT